MVFTNHFAVWFPKIKTIVQAAFTASEAAGVIPTKGIVYSYDEWPENLITLPAALIGMRDGDQFYGAGTQAISIHNVGIWIYFNAAFKYAGPMKWTPDIVLRIRDGLAANLQLDGTVEHCLPPDPPQRFYQGPGEMLFAGKQYVGVILNLKVKVNESGVFTVS